MTDVEICNLAIGRLGITTFIGTMDELSKEGRNCRRLYASVRDRVLEAVNWPFARAESDLQDVGVPPSGWAYKFRYPSDCVRAREVKIDGGYPVPFLVIEDETSNALAILTNISPAKIVYTKRIMSTRLFTPSFESAFSWLLAAELALPLTTDAKLASYCNSVFQLSIREAASLSLNGQSEPAQPTDTYISTRQ